MNFLNILLDFNKNQASKNVKIKSKNSNFFDFEKIFENALKKEFKVEIDNKNLFKNIKYENIDIENGKKLNKLFLKFFKIDNTLFKEKDSSKELKTILTNLYKDNKKVDIKVEKEYFIDKKNSKNVKLKDKKDIKNIEHSLIFLDKNININNKNINKNIEKEVIIKSAIEDRDKKGFVKLEKRDIKDLEITKSFVNENSQKQSSLSNSSNSLNSEKENPDSYAKSEPKNSFIQNEFSKNSLENILKEKNLNNENIDKSILTKFIDKDIKNEKKVSLESFQKNLDNEKDLKENILKNSSYYSEIENKNILTKDDKVKFLQIDSKDEISIKKSGKKVEIESLKTKKDNIKVEIFDKKDSFNSKSINSEDIKEEVIIKSAIEDRDKKGFVKLEKRDIKDLEITKNFVNENSQKQSSLSNSSNSLNSEKDNPDSYAKSEPKNSLENVKNSFSFKMNDMIINATLKNRFLTLSLNINSSILLTNHLESDIKAILKESGFKNFQVIIKDREKEKKIYENSLQNSDIKRSVKSKIYVMA